MYSAMVSWDDIAPHDRNLDINEGPLPLASADDATGNLMATKTMKITKVTRGNRHRQTTFSQMIRPTYIHTLWAIKTEPT